VTGPAIRATLRFNQPCIRLGSAVIPRGGSYSHLQGIAHVRFFDRPPEDG